VGERTPDGTLRFAGWRIVTAGYFRTLGIPILAGEPCRMSPDSAHAFEALVNQKFVDRYSSGREPIGRTLSGGPIGDSMPRIVGVVADVREDGAGKDAIPVIYACGYLRFWPDSDILIRTAGDPVAMTNAVQQQIRAVESTRPIYAIQPLAERLSGALVEDRFRTALVSLFSVMALILAAIGLYGAMAYMVAQRTKEIGVRVTLGARPGQILSEVLFLGGKLTFAGALTGIALAVIATRSINALLYGVRPLDAVTYLAAVATLSAVALLACLVPARRAMAIDPVRALRG
jgi:putative ABC transport system permease protein